MRPRSRSPSQAAPSPPPPVHRLVRPPTVFQRPHPDDRGGAEGKPSKGGAKDKVKSKAQGKTKDGKRKAVGRCGNCDAEGAVLRCGQCGTEVYCGEACQRVSGW